MALDLPVIGIERDIYSYTVRFRIFFITLFFVIPPQSMQAHWQSNRIQMNVLAQSVVMPAQFDIKCKEKRDIKVERAEKPNFGFTIASRNERKKEK